MFNRTNAVCGRSDGRSNLDKLVAVGVRIATAVLLATAAAKLASAHGQARILSLPDPVLGIEHRYLLIGVGLIELSIGSYLIAGQSGETKSWVLLWIAAVFGSYRLVRWSLNIPEPCPCLGSVLNLWPWVRPYMDFLLASSIWMFLLIGVLGLRGRICALVTGWAHKERFWSSLRDATKPRPGDGS